MLFFVGFMRHAVIQSKSTIKWYYVRWYGSLRFGSIRFNSNRMGSDRIGECVCVCVLLSPHSLNVHVHVSISIYVRRPIEPRLEPTHVCMRYYITPVRVFRMRILGIQQQPEQRSKLTSEEHKRFSDISTEQRFLISLSICLHFVFRLQEKSCVFLCVPKFFVRILISPVEIQSRFCTFEKRVNEAMVQMLKNSFHCFVCDVA